MSSTPDHVPASPTTVRQAAVFFAAHGLARTPVRRGDTKGRLTGWSQPGHNADASAFGPDDNVGLLNGTQPAAGWFFHDVHLQVDSDEARRIARRLLPDTGWRYGRSGQPASHHNYLVPKPLRTRQYVGMDDAVVIELRGLTRKKTHTLSVAPGSTHDSGEPIRFCEPRGEIGQVNDPDTLDRAVQFTALALLLTDVWPEENQDRLPLGLREHAAGTRGTARRGEHDP